MNTRYSARKTIKRWAAVTGMLMAAATVQADMLSPTLYGDELERCTAEMRSGLNLAGVTRLQHAMTAIDKVGAWYVFDIQTTAYDEADTVMIEASTQCKAHRWTAETVVDIQSRYPTVRPGIELARAVSSD